MLEEAVKRLGFESVNEFHKLNSEPDLSIPGILEMYNEWRSEDGTKAGLLKVIEQCNKRK